MELTSATDLRQSFFGEDALAIVLTYEIEICLTTNGHKGTQIGSLYRARLLP